MYPSFDAKFYTKIYERCRECEAVFTGYIYKKPAKKADVILECTLKGDLNKIIHKKRHLKGYLRERIASELIDTQKSACVWRLEEARRVMNMGDMTPPILFDNSVLRKAKEEAFNQRYNLQNTDPIMNLHVAKYGSLMGIIRSILHILLE